MHNSVLLPWSFPPQQFLPLSAVSFFLISLSPFLLSSLASSNSSNSMLFCHASQIDLEVGQRWHVLFATTAVFHGGSCHLSVCFHLVWKAALCFCIKISTASRNNICPISFFLLLLYILIKSIINHLYAICNH